MSYRFVKRHNAIGWDWYLLESDECESWVSQSVKEVIETLEADNAKLRELVKEMRVCLEDECKRCHEWDGDICDLEHQMRELGVEANG